MLQKKPLRQGGWGIIPHPASMNIPERTQSSIPLVTIDRKASCREALELMMKHHIHHLAVTENNDPIGILNDRDIFFRWVKGSFNTRFEFDNTPIETVIRSHLPIANEKTTLSEVLDWMNNSGTSAILAKKEPNDWRIITESDLLNALDFVLKKKDWHQRLIFQGEKQLASPVVQKLLETLTQMGI